MVSTTRTVGDLWVKTRPHGQRLTGRADAIGFIVIERDFDGQFFRF